MNIKKITLVITTVALIFSSIFVINAADVNVTDAVTIQLTIGTELVNFQLQPVGITSFSVTANSINVTTVGDKAKLTAPTNISFGVATDCTTPSVSSYIIPENSSVTVTPTKPASTETEYSNTCDGRLSGGGGNANVGGGSGGGGGGGPTVVPPVVKPPKTGTTTITIPGPLVFKDVTGKIKAEKTVKAINTITDLMKNNYKFISTFGPNKKATFYFVTSMSLAVAGEDCDGKPSPLQCKKAAAKLGLIDESDLKKTSVKIGEVYKMLLGAANIPLLDESAVTANLQCKDVSKQNEYYAVVATARKYGIGFAFTGGKCKPYQTLSKASAALYGMRTLDAVKKLKSSESK